MKLILPIVVLVFLAGAGFFFLNRSTSPAVSPTPSNNSVLTPSPTIDNSDLMQGGSSFADPNGLFTILYPSDYTIDTQDKIHPRIYKQGPTQKGQTEMYDGVIVVFENVDLKDQTLEEWVNAHIKSSTADGTTEVVEPHTVTSLNNNPGYTYKLRGLGESTNYVVQKDTNSKNAVLITTLVADPTSAGFQGQVDKILSTLKILK